MHTSEGVGRWTRWFAVASALALVVVQLVALVGGGRVRLAVVALFGFVCPMIFGMGYLLLPSLVGRTLVDGRLPGVHFLLSLVGGTCVVGGIAFSLGRAVVTVGVVLWSLGVAVFVGSLLRTVLPVVIDRPEVVLRSEDRPQRSTRLATVAIPVAVGYLAVGTLALLGYAELLPSSLPAGLAGIVHLYAAGFGALLIFSLGARLMAGFFHVTPPRGLTWVVLTAGAVGPGLLGAALYGGDWFAIGAVLEATAMTGYLFLVAIVYSRSDWRRVGFDGILLGAVGGVAAVAVNLPLAFDIGVSGQLPAHATLVVTGFFALTDGARRGATDRVARASMAAFTAGAGVRAVGFLGGVTWLQRGGAVVALAGACGYCYLVCGRFLNR